MKLVHPYVFPAGGRWLKGNLHCHSTQSDGRPTPQEVIKNYAALGHDFLMFADHEVFTSEEQYKQWDNHGLTLIPGVEIAGGQHLLYVDGDRTLSPRQPRQAILNQIVALAETRGRGFAIMNHPSWHANFNHATIEQLQQWIGYTGIEIFNGVIGRLEGSAYALDKWDMLLSGGRRIWGYANDDNHAGAVEAGLGWNVVFSRSRDVADICAALRNGCFYASTGVEITAISVKGTTIRVETANADRLVAVREHGIRFKVVDQNWIEFDVPENAIYVRVECYGRGEQSAWTQPFFVEQDAVVSAQPSVAQKLSGIWSCSIAIESSDLEEASPAEAAKLSFKPYRTAREGVLAGFIDLRKAFRGKNGYVYALGKIDNARAGRAIMKFGHDGPIRIWLNDRELFHGPGANPAVPDSVQLYASLRKGGNTILVAMHANAMKAWGFWCRVVQDKQIL